MENKTSEALVGKVVDELAKLRKKQGLSHDKLAELTGLTRPAISFIESHKHVPTLVNAAKIAHALGVQLSDVIGQFEK